ncbi:MAG: hypothetical protein FD166_3796, partial [Bacteroidetes bacterium]
MSIWSIFSRSGKQLKSWRKSLSIGDKVKVRDGAVEFNAQVVHKWDDRVQVISN